MSKRSYSLEDKYRAAAAVVASGSVESASRQTGIPASTIRDWGKDEEFKKFGQEIRAEYGDEIKSNLAQIVKEGTDQIQDRIKDGDYILDKKGEMIRRPMSGRDLTITTGVAFDKLRVLEGQPTQIIRQDDGLSMVRKLAHTKAAGEAKRLGGKELKQFPDEEEWWKQLPDDKKEAFQKAVDRLGELAPAGTIAARLEYLKQAALALQEADG